MLQKLKNLLIITNNKYFNVTSIVNEEDTLTSHSGGQKYFDKMIFKINDYSINCKIIRNVDNNLNILMSKYFCNYIRLHSNLQYVNKLNRNDI